MAQQQQQIIPVDQLVPKFQSIGRCNNYVVLQNIPCLLECNTVGQLLLDQPLSYALTATADVPAVYLQQFWKTVSKVPDTNDTIHFKLNNQEIVYNVDMFRSTLNLPVETTKNPFIKQVTMKFIQPFMIVGYQGVVDKYHFIKDDIPLVTIYTTGNVTVRGMLIPNEFITNEIHVTEEYKDALRSPTLTTDIASKKKRKQVAEETSSPRKSLKVTIRQKKSSITPILPPGDDQKRDDIDEATLLSLTLHKTALVAEARENIAKVKEKLEEEEIEKMVEREDGEESYASEFADSMFQDDDDDSGNRIEPGSHKEHLKIVDDDDDDETEKEKKDDKKNDEKANDDKKKDEMSSIETRKEKMQTPIPSLTRSPRTNLSLDNTLSEELTTTVSPSTTTTSKVKRKTKAKRKTRSTSINDNCADDIREVLDHCNNVMPELTIAKTNEMLNEEVPRLVNLAVNRDREIAPTNVPELISKEFAAHAPSIIA
ncbi:hypothetical protein Tco_0357072 [Tanacetum coccineum]